MEQKLPPEYFKLIRDVLREKKDEPERPLKRKRSKPASKEKEVVEIKSSSEPEIIDVGSTDDLFEESASQYSEDDDYESEDFEDVTDSLVTPEPHGDITVSVETRDTKNRSHKRARNVVSNQERHWRRYFHMAYLLCLCVHGCVRNDWINDVKLGKKLCKLVPEKVLQQLHPDKDEEMPLRSTRKLLDGLKSCMEVWNKHWKITRAYKSTGCYMKLWDEIKTPCDEGISGRLFKKAFVKQILRGNGDRDVAAQGFVALLRSCNVNARLVMSLQPPDFTDLKATETRTAFVSPATLFKFPIFWCEVWDKFSKKWITIDAINLKTIEQIKTQSKLEPRGSGSCQRNLLRYVIGFDRKKGCRDVTRRYSHWFNCKCIRKRITKDISGDKWYSTLLKRLHQRKRTRMDDYEDEYFEQRNESEGMPDNLQDLRNHPRYVLEKDLKSNQVIRPGGKECGYLNVHHKKELLKVYEKKDILDLKSARQWYMDGKVLKVGSRSLKSVPRRSRSGKDSDEMERLYRMEDTELYVPPLASQPEGRIVKNTFENIEVFTPSMIPANCVLIESDVAVKAARFLQIEYARAVTGFSFERGRTTKPIIGGVVVAQWFKEAVLYAIEALKDIIEEEEDEKNEVANLTRWNFLLVKLRIKSELNSTYGRVEEQISSGQSPEKEDEMDEMEGGGFLAVGNQTAEEPAEENETEDPDPRVDGNRYGQSGQVGQILQLENTQDGEDSYDEFMNELDISDSE
ncbi:related to DNA repair protein RAD4 [Zygosaccharomyces bailii ISA1307]|uniref:BN860_11892g1_1 n=1 Tax=Zygosaccharomyces bailii (strain CLIB 213 / ATCC 58445 / CBS 680 / BCRC 21525 / NBRC 1098 / NCYC 1416 / NRRL Y-2227) TaxID=1333698 RepID=A0A8J2T5Q5_ZYGB2|nr:BN860_11892g1_1 [Zygosaccharomyces bailii CLIB 213]CDH14612.1 related to DNA repair protein RAD4 [Zygosaccharomyces bailii ISA1307]